MLNDSSTKKAIDTQMLRREYGNLDPNVHVDIVSALSGFDDGTDTVYPVRVYRTDSKKSKELFTHDTFDIIYTENTDAAVDLCGKTVAMKKHSVIFIPPGVSYRISVDENGVAPVFTVKRSLIASHFHRISEFSGALSAFFANGMWGETVNGYMLYTTLQNSGIRSILNQMIMEELYRHRYSDFIQIQLLLCVMGYLAEQNPSTYELSQGKIVRSEQINKILTFIQDNYRTVTLEKLASNFHYTVPYVSKLIRSSTGLTFTEILREIKFDVCRSLLLNSDLKINRIAEVAGFQNTDHFNRIFKKRMGETPTEYKRNRTFPSDNT